MTSLFAIETARCRLVWEAPTRGRPASRRDGDGGPAGELWIDPLGKELRVCCSAVESGGAEINTVVSAPAVFPLRLYEQTGYAVFLDAASEETVSLRHRDPVLLRELRCYDDGRVVSGRIDFRGQIGRSRFSVYAAEQREFDFTVEVFPSKLDYAEDYRRLIGETQDLLAGLVVEYLRPTEQSGRTRPHGNGRPLPSTAEWLLLLRAAVDDLERALLLIDRRPAPVLSRRERITRAELARNVPSATHRALARGGGEGGTVRLGVEMVIRERIRQTSAGTTLDTPEHRWLAARLARVRRRLARVRRTIASGGDRDFRGRAARVRDELEGLEGRLSRLAHLRSLAAASVEPPTGFASVRLLSAPGYRDAYAAFGTLSLGLDVDRGPARLSVRDLHLLWEQWCYLALVKLTAAATGNALPARQLLVTEENRLRPALRRGKESGVDFAAPGGLRIVLRYNPRFAGEPLLVAQQPDLLIEVLRDGSVRRRFVLDAKYRLDASKPYVRRYGAPGPPEDALNTLHRYRDALRSGTRDGTGTLPPGVDQAVALFPWDDDPAGAFRASRLWRSIERIGVGAIPVLPGCLEYLEEWLRKVVKE